MYDPSKGLLRKINSIDIVKSDGSSQKADLSRKNKKIYSITANSYMLEYIGIIKKKTFGLINVVPKDSKGNPVVNMKAALLDLDESAAGLQEGKEWLAIMQYLSSMNDINSNNIPDIDQKYKEPVRTFFLSK